MVTPQRLHNGRFPFLDLHPHLALLACSLLASFVSLPVALDLSHSMSAPCFTKIAGQWLSPSPLRFLSHPSSTHHLPPQLVSSSSSPLQLYQFVLSLLAKYSFRLGRSYTPYPKVFFSQVPISALQLHPLHSFTRFTACGIDFRTRCHKHTLESISLVLTDTLLLDTLDTGH